MPSDVRQPNELQMIEHLGGLPTLNGRALFGMATRPRKMATQLEHFAGRIENLLPLGCTDLKCCGSRLSISARQAMS